MEIVAKTADAVGKLLGVVLPRSVEEACLKNKTVYAVEGTIGGRGISHDASVVTLRSAFLIALSMNIFLYHRTASVIALYEDTLAAAIALALFSTVVSDMRDVIKADQRG